MEECDYIESKNVDTILQWITGELLSSKPQNPIAFIQNLTFRKQRTNYIPEHADELLASIHHNSDNLTEESPFSDLANSLENMRNIKGGSHIHVLLHQAQTFVRSTFLNLYSIHKQGHHLYLEGEKNAPLVEITSGFVGAAYTTGKFIHVEDNVEDDPRYDDAIYNFLRTNTIQSVMVIPVTDENNKVVAVLEAINCKNTFQKFHEDLLKIFATQLKSLILEGGLKERYTQITKRLTALLDLIKTINYNSQISKCAISPLIFTITRRAQEIVESDRCTLYLVDNDAKQLWSMHGEVNICIPLNKGIAGTCAQSGEVINITDAYKDERFNPAFDKKSGYKTNTILTIPMKNEKNEILGVLQLINKVDGVFTEEDSTILRIILSHAVSSFSKVASFKRGKSKAADPDEIMPAELSVKRSRRTPTISAIIEEDCDYDTDHLLEFSPFATPDII